MTQFLRNYYTEGLCFSLIVGKRTSSVLCLSIGWLTIWQLALSEGGREKVGVGEKEKERDEERK